MYIQILALFIMFCIGAGLGTLSRRFTEKLWLASHGSAAIGTVVWVTGFYGFLWFSEPGELPPPDVISVLFAYILMFIAAAVAVQAAEARDAHRNPLGTKLPKKPDDE